MHLEAADNVSLLKVQLLNGEEGSAQTAAWKAWTQKSEHEPLSFCPVTDIVGGHSAIKVHLICTSLEECEACSFITKGH